MNGDDILNFFTRAIHPLKLTVALLAGKAVIKAVKDSDGIQEVQISALAGESMDRVPRVQDFGFSSNPPLGSEAIIINLGGLRENVVVIKADNRAARKKNLVPGECAIFTDDGTFIHLKKNGEVYVKTSTKVTVEAPNAEFTGNVKVNGTLTVVGTSHFQGAVQADLTVNATVGMGAGSYSGPLGGAPSPVVMTVPLNSTAAITTSADVSGGGTSLSAIKTKHNAHKHAETGTTTGVPDQIL